MSGSQDSREWRHRLEEPLSAARALQLLTQGCLEAAERLAKVLKIGMGSPFSDPGINI